jgi:hypothetical protein
MRTAFLMNEDGTASMWDWNDPVFVNRVDIGEDWWTSLYTPCCSHGLVASAFEHSIAIESVYDAREALPSHMCKLPSPIGTRSAYKVTYANGKKFPEGVHPSEV